MQCARSASRTVVKQCDVRDIFFQRKYRFVLKDDVYFTVLAELL